MAVNLVDLQLIYGVAGAREKFEDLASQLVKAEQPKADKVRLDRGDAGIDVHVGELTDPGGIDIYQCKFFTQGLEESQKNQIRKSFQGCRDSKEFKVKKWILCLPVDLSVDEKKWFEDWRAKQIASGVAIEDPWGATKLEGLLYQEKHRGLREAFFKEEHLTQIRDSHALLQRLLPDIAERLRQDTAEREQARLSDALARQANDLDQFVRVARENYMAEVSQAVRAAGTRDKRPAHWEVVIRPSSLPARGWIETLTECMSIVQTCQVQSNGWHYPILPRDPGERLSGQDWVSWTRVFKREVESWRLSQQGLFVHMFPIWDDVHDLNVQPAWLPFTVPAGFVPQHFLDIDVAIRTITHIFRFAAKLAKKVFDPSETATEIAIRLTGTRDRVLFTTDDPRRLQGCFRAIEAALENNWSCKPKELGRDPDHLARRAARWFLERFGGGDAVSDQVLSSIQSRLFSSR
jgi:hypothetical protein